MAQYSIWLLEYARCPSAALSSIIYGQHNAGTCEMAFSYCVLIGEGQVIMLDVGYDYETYGGDLSELSNLELWQPAEKVLGKIGLHPRDVDTVILSHAHFDHMGNMGAFPRAHFFLQKKELLDWTWALSLPHRFSALRKAMDPKDILQAAALSFEGRLTLLDGAVQDVRPGIHVRPAYDAHTFGSQIVVIETQSRTQEERWVYAGDSAYSYRNIRGLDDDGVYRAVGLATGSTVNMLMAIEDMVQTARGLTERIIVPHDPLAWSLYPSRVTADGLHIAELSLAQGAESRLDRST